MRRRGYWFLHGDPSQEEQDDGTLLASGAHNIWELFYLRGGLADKYMLLQCIYFQGMAFAKMPGKRELLRAFSFRYPTMAPHTRVLTISINLATSSGRVLPVCESIIELYTCGMTRGTPASSQVCRIMPKLSSEIPPVGSISVMPLRAAVVASAYSSGNDFSPPIGKNFAACAPESSGIAGNAGWRALAAADPGRDQHFPRRARGTD